MPGAIIYLDIDDEITSAASRIRDVPGRRVALVLPFGSRVATSRINFRLLSRDAMINEKQLAVVAGESATRALAASAGLPVFASVSEYESSVADAVEDDPAGHPGAPPARKSAAPPAAATPAVEVPPSTAAETTPTTRTRRGRTSNPSGTDAGVDVLGDVGEGAALSGSWAGPRPSSAAPAEYLRKTRPAPRPRSRLPILIVLAAFGLVLLAGGVGAYVVLPSATIVVTPRTEPLVPLSITVTADPTATEPDIAGRVVPATLVTLEVTANDTFPATGKRVTETEARGTVRFANLDFLRSNSVAAGSVVSTNAGVRFRTVAAVTVPRADLVGLTVFPGRISVNVIAVEPGTAGNVEPNTIVIVPKGKDPQALKVVNPDATSGGAHDEFPQVVQEDIDGATEQLTKALAAEFQARLVDPSIAAPGATVFGETASLGDATPSVDPATLVGQEIDTFELGLKASGTVLTADPAPVGRIADELLRATLRPGHDLVAGSIEVSVGEPVVTGSSVAFPATATGEEVAVLDPGELRALVLGKSLDGARAILAPYGDVVLTAWPDWVGSIPTIADRVDVRIEQGVPVETPAATGSTP